MVKISKRVAMLVVVLSVIFLIVLFDLFIFFPDSFSFPKVGSKMEISDLTIEPSSNWLSSNIRLTVTNTYNSPVTVVGSRVNGVSYGFIDLEIPPGQTKNVAFPLSNLAITNSTVYDAKLTFTFDNGQYEVYSETITPEKYAGAAVIDKIAYTMTNETLVSITFHNSGNIPLTGAKITLGNYEIILPLTHTILPKETGVFENQTISGTFETGISYSAKYEFTFADRSVFSATNSVTFKENVK